MYLKQSDATEEAMHRLHEGDGTVRACRLFPDDSRLPTKMAVWELDPGSSEGSHVHEGLGALEEIYYFLQGSGVMWVDGEEVEVRTGDVVMVSPGADHGFRNSGDSVLKLLIAWGPPEDAA